MPGGGGERAARSIRAISPDTKVIGHSTSEDHQEVRAMLAAGAHGYIVKGASWAELSDSVHAVFRGERRLSTECMNGVLEEYVDQVRSKDLATSTDSA